MALWSTSDATDAQLFMEVVGGGTMSQSLVAFLRAIIPQGAFMLNVAPLGGFSPLLKWFGSAPCFSSCWGAWLAGECR